MSERGRVFAAAAIWVLVSTALILLAPAVRDLDAGRLPACC
jgi:hypothetical protein